MAKITLTDLVNLQNENTAVSNINANNAAIETALEKTLSRDGTSPNQMGASLDMNSNRILNLPAPTFNTDPVRLQELSTVVGGGTVSNIPAGGNAGDVLTKTSGTDYQYNWTAFSADITAGSNIVVTGTSPATIATSLTPTFTSVNKLTITAPATSAVLTIANAKTLTVSNTLTLAGTDGTTQTFQASDTIVGRATTDTLTNKTLDAATNTFTGTQASLTAGHVTTNANLTGVITSVGNATSIASQTGTGSKFVVDTTPTLVTPVLGVATATSINKVAITAPATSATLTIANLKTLTASNSLTLAGTDATTITFQGTDTYVGRTTTDTLTNKSISGSTNTLSSIALSSHATQAAFTLVGNNTSGAAAPTAVDIALLTTKASPAATDYVMISDQAATGAWKKATVGTLASAGSVASIAGNTGAFTLSNGITNSTNDIRLNIGHLPGETTTGSAAAGEIGEYITANLAVASILTLVTGTAANVISISLTAGDWDVMGITHFSAGGSATVTNAISGITTTSATIPNNDSGAISYVIPPTNDTVTSVTPPVRVSLSATTTVYLVAKGVFTSNLSVWGTIRARRMR